MMFNSVEFCVTFLALTKLGAVVIPLPSKYSRNEVLSLTAKADLQYILCDEKFYDWFVPLETSGVHLMKPGRIWFFPPVRLLSQPRSLPWQGGG